VKDPRAASQALAGEDSLDLVGLLVPPSRVKDVVHPAIVHVILTFFKQVASLLDTRTPFHVSFEAQLVEDLDRTKAALPTHAPLHLKPPDLSPAPFIRKTFGEYSRLVQKLFGDQVKASKLVLQKAAKDLALFSFFTKETEYLKGGMFGQFSAKINHSPSGRFGQLSGHKHAGKPAACRCSPKCWAKMVFVDGHHKVFTQLHDGRAYAYGLLCRGGHYGRTACTGMHLSLYDEVAPVGCSKDGQVVPFLQTVEDRASSWVADEALGAIDRFLGSPVDPTSHIMVFITIRGDTFSLPYPLHDPLRCLSFATNHGFLPSIHLHFTKKRSFGWVEVRDCGSRFLDLSAEPCLKTSHINLASVLGIKTVEMVGFLNPDFVTSLELFIWLALCDKPYLIGSFGFRALHWNHDGCRNPSPPCIYHLPLSTTGWSFVSLLDRVWNRAVVQVKTRLQILSRSHKAKLKREFEAGPSFQDHQMKEHTYKKAIVHLAKVKEFFISIA